MKKSKREALIKAVEIILIAFNIVDICTLTTRSKLGIKVTKIRVLYELCFDELRRDKPSEKIIRAYMDKAMLLSKDKS